LPTIKCPPPLRPYLAGQKSVSVVGNSVIELIQDMIRQFPAVKQNIFDPEGRIRPYINLYLEGKNIKELNDGLDTLVGDKDSLEIIASMSGG
jgi:molybdopterin synthase sulfur carrier subunit